MFVTADFSLQKYGFNISDPTVQRALSVFMGNPLDENIENDIILS